MTAAKVMDIISRLPGCAGQAAAGVSAYTQVKMKNVPKLSKKFQNRSVQTFGFFYHDTNGLNYGPVWKTQSFLLKGNLYGHPLAGLLWERQFEKILLQHGWEKVSNWECFFVHLEKGSFLSVYVDDIKLAGKKQNIDPMWKVLLKEIDLGEPTSFLDHENFGCTQRQCEISKDIVDNYSIMLESRISAGGNWKTSILREFSYFFMVLWHGRSCQEMCGTRLWVSKQDDSTTVQSIYSHASMTTISKKKKQNL